MKLLLALLCFSSSAVAATQTDLIGFRGQKGWTSLATLEYEAGFPLIDERSGPDGKLTYIVNFHFQVWDPKGNPVWYDSSLKSAPYPIVSDRESTYVYLWLDYDTVNKRILYGDFGGFSSGDPYGPFGYSPSAYLGVSWNWAPWRAVLMDDNTTPDGGGFVLDQGRIKIGGIPTHAPDSAPSLVLALLGLGGLLLLRQKTK